MDCPSFEAPDWKEGRRMRALSLKQQDWKQRDIAAALGVSKGAVSRWLATAQRDGAAALLSHPAPGPVPKLSPDQQRLIPDFLWHGAEAHGFLGDVWPCARVPRVLAAHFRVHSTNSL